MLSFIETKLSWLAIAFYLIVISVLTKITAAAKGELDLSWHLTFRQAGARYLPLDLLKLLFRRSKHVYLYSDVINFMTSLYFFRQEHIPNAVSRMSWIHLIIHIMFLLFLYIILFSSLFLVSLENITTDVHELEKGMDLVRKEFELRGKEKHNTVLRDFLNNSEEKLRRLKSDARAAGEAFRECVEFFGESPRQADANTFFSLLVRFARAFKVPFNFYTIHIHI